MPKPTVQNHPKPEPKTSPAAKKAVRRVVDEVTGMTPTQTWAAQDGAIDELCSFVLSKGHMAEFCVNKGLNYTSMLRWLNASEERTKLYADARECRADALADEIISISDEVSVITTIDDGGAVELKLDATAVARNRLRVDARKWAAAKLKPKAYGDKVTQEHVGKDGGPIQTAQLDLRGLSEAELEQMQLLLSKAGAK